MNKFIVAVLTQYFKEMKAVKNYENLESVRNIINNEIKESQCINMYINDSSTADSFYGMIVFPKLALNTEKELYIESYAIEIQKQLLDILEPDELVAMLIHDISHNVLTNTVLERLKAAIYKSAKMSNMKIAEIVYNIDNRIRNLAILDIANRTYKEKIIPGLDMYEPDRIIADLDIWESFNSSIEKIRREIDIEDISNPDQQDISDVYIGTKVIKMIREKAKGIVKTYTEVYNYIITRYDTKIFNIYPNIEVSEDEEKFGEKVSEIETLKPYELQFLRENVYFHISNKKSYASTLLENVFALKRPNISEMQKELVIISFKIESMESNYARLAILDRIYDNIFVIEKYLEDNPTDETVISYLKKFNDMTIILKDTKVAKKQYSILSISNPVGYEG